MKNVDFEYLELERVRGVRPLIDSYDFEFEFEFEFVFKFLGCR